MTRDEILTRTSDTEAAIVEIFSGNTRDQIILIREAVNALRTGAASKISATVQMKDWTLTVRARK